MQPKKQLLKIISVTLSVLMVILISVAGFTASSEISGPVLTFSDGKITETVSGSGYTISFTTLTITSPGTYIVTGSCSEGNIEISKSLSDVVLVLNDLTLSSSKTAPIVVKKSTSATIHLTGTSTVTDKEDPDNETSSDTTVADAFEGAAIKVKSGSTLVFCGDGTLKADGSNCKNAIKGGTSSSIVFNGGTYEISAANNGIAADGSLVFNAGTFTIDADNDGIKSVPDTDDTESSGTVTINGGTYDLTVDGDGIQAETKLEINNGTFNIKTMNGYSSSGFDENTMSCKGLKASGDRENIENDLVINGGTFTLNTRDDAIHSDTNAEIFGGTFIISTGDDGVHADTSLTLGVEGSTFSRDPDITINNSYEGLEAGNLYIYQGRYYIKASDDGINAAGGSSSGSDPGQGGDHFNPGGGPGRPGGQGGPGNFNPASNATDYNIYIYGGDVYVNCTGDGLDSNGGLYLYGGNISVFSMAAGGDNSPADADGTISIKGATVFLAGGTGMDALTSSDFGQKYYISTSRYNANTVLNVTHNSTLVYSDRLPRTVNYVVYSSPSMTSNSCTLASASSVNSCKSNDWAHSYDSGTVTKTATSDSNGVVTYTCSSCSKKETKTALYYNADDYACDGVHAYEAETADDKGYNVTFTAGEGAKINIYYTQDYSQADETDVTSAVSRNSDTGDPDSTGSGQVNFAIVLDEGYSLDGDPVISGSYNKLKDISSESGVSNSYRVTKVSGDLTITVKTVLCAHENVSKPTWTWSDDKATATATFFCSDCNQSVDVKASVTSSLDSDGKTITFIATAEIGGQKYTDSVKGEAFTVSFITDEHTSVIVYHTQDYSSADETGVSTSVARDSDSGDPIISGDGQINFTVVVDDGYELDGAPAVSGSYKNLKDVSTGDLPYTYRVTKIAGDITVTVVSKEKEATGTTEDSTGSSQGDYLIGDVDQNGSVEIVDATLIQQYLAKIISFSDEKLIIADVDKDGSVTVADATRIQQYLAKLIDLEA